MSGGLRIGDAERDRAAAELGEHFALGRIDDDEHGERLDAVWTARTQADLDVLFADLPPLHPQAPVSRGGRGGRPPEPHGRSGWRAVPFVPILVVLGVLTVLTHIPFVLIALVVGVVLWSKANRRRRRSHGDWSAHSAPHWR